MKWLPKVRSATYTKLDQEVSPNKIVSYENYNRLYSTSFSNLKPLYNLLLHACLTKPANPSTTIVNKIGDNESPCLNPLMIEKSSIGHCSMVEHLAM